jgi:hypothetical protein
MRKLLNKIFGARKTPVLLPSLVVRWIEDEEVLSKTLQRTLNEPGVQALIQALETEAAAEMGLALRNDAAANYHAGGASALLNVLRELGKLR